MKIKRVVANIAVADPAAAQRFLPGHPRPRPPHGHGLDRHLRLARVTGANVPIEYGPTHEPWGVRRFFVCDPLGTLVNILVHDDRAD